MTTELKHQSYGWLLVIVTAVAIFLAAGRRGTLKLQEIKHQRIWARSICVNNEKQLGICFRAFGVDLGGFPLLISNTNSTANAPELVDARPNQTEASSAQ